MERAKLLMRHGCHTALFAFQCQALRKHDTFDEVSAKLS